MNLTVRYTTGTTLTFTGVEIEPEQREDCLRIRITDLMGEPLAVVTCYGGEDLEMSYPDSEPAHILPTAEGVH